jgi:hypothetical protein
MYKKCTLMLFSTAGALALGATVAMAAGWRPYGNTSPITSGWACGTTRRVTDNETVLGQVCTVRSADRRFVTGAVIVRNNNSFLYSTSAGVTLFYPNGNRKGHWSCSLSGVAANSWSVCFGTTVPANGDSYYTYGYANTRSLLYSPTN